MGNFRILYAAFIMVLIGCLVFPMAPVAADTPEVDLASSPYVIYPKDEDIFTTTPKFRFTKFPGVTKYRIDVWNGDDLDQPPLYTVKFSPDCNVDECWYKPATALKKYDLSGEKGEYTWRIRAKEGGEWPPLWSQTTFRVLSSGFNSTFDLNYKKWLLQAGVWSVTSAGYLKTNGLLGTTASIARAELFTETTNDANGMVYEVMMKRKVEQTSTNRIFFLGYPGVTPEGGVWERGYCLDYTDDGRSSLYRLDDYSKTFHFEEMDVSAIINPNGWNRLTVWKNSGTIHVWINKVYLGGYPDSNYTEGWVGIGVYEADAEKSPLLVDWATLKYSDTAPHMIP